MAYGLESRDEYKKRKLREQLNPVTPVEGTWNENDVRALREYYARPPAPPTPIPMAQVVPQQPEQMNWWESLKSKTLPVLGGASESVGKPIARLINQIAGYDEGLTEEQLRRKYGMQRLLGREPTQTDEFMYGIGSTIPVVAGGTLIPKLGLGTTATIGTGVGYGGLVGGVGEYGRGGTAEDIKKSAIESAAFMPGLMGGTGIANRLMKNMPSGFIKGGIGDIAGALGGTATAGLSRTAMGGEAPTSQEYLQNILANLIVGRGTAATEGIFKSYPKATTPPIQGKATTPVETPEQRAANIGDILNLNRPPDIFGRTQPEKPIYSPLGTEQQQRGILELFGRIPEQRATTQGVAETPMSVEQRAAEQAQRMASNITGRPSIFDILTPEQKIAKQVGQFTQGLNIPETRPIEGIYGDIARQQMREQQAQQQPILDAEYAKRLAEQQQLVQNAMNRPTIDVSPDELLRRQNIRLGQTTQPEIAQTIESQMQRISDLQNKIAETRPQFEAETLKPYMKTGEPQVNILDILSPQQQAREIMTGEQLGMFPNRKELAQQFETRLQEFPYKSGNEAPLYETIQTSPKIEPAAKSAMIGEISLMKSQNKFFDQKGFLDFINNERVLPINNIELARSIIQDFSQTPTKFGAIQLYNDLVRLPERKLNTSVLEHLYQNLDKVIKMEDLGLGIHVDVTGLKNELFNMINSNTPVNVKTIDQLLQKYAAVEKQSPMTETGGIFGNQRGGIRLPDFLFPKEEGSGVKKKDKSNLIDLSWMGMQKFINPEPPVAKNGEFQIRSIADKDPKTMSYMFREFMQKNLDSKWTLSEMSKIANDPYLKALSYNTNHTGVIADRIIDYNMVNMDGQVVGKSLKSVFEGLTKPEFDDFLQYQYNKHNIDRLRRGLPIDTKIDENTSLQNIRLLEMKNPKLIEVSKNWQEFNRNLLKNLVLDEGIIDVDTYNRILQENPNYIPTPRAGYLGGPDVLKRATGSTTDRAILNGVEIMIDTVRKFVNVASRQRLYNRLYETALKDPESMRPFMEILPPSEKPIKIKNIDSLDNYVNNILRLKDPNDVMAGRIKNLMINGEMKRIKLNDDLLFDSLESLPQRQQDEALTLMRRGTNFAKSLITTYNPLFGLANLARDLIVGYINSRTTLNPVKYFVDFGGSLLDIILKRPIYQDYLNMGGGGMVARQGGLNPSKSTAAKAKSFLKATDPIDVFYRVAKDTLENINLFNEAIESASRLAEYKRVLKVMGDTPEGRQLAINAADEVTVNFGKRGSAQRIKTLDTFYPYFNAALQGGLNPFTQQSGGNLVPMLGKAVFSVALPSIISYLFLKDDPEYQKLDQRIKDDFLVTPFKVDGKFVKIPLSKEYALPLHAIPVRMLEAVMKGKPESFTNELLTAILRNYAPLHPIQGSILSPLGRTYFSEAGTDWLGRPLLNKEDLQVEPYLQYDENTSAPAKLMGKIFNISPKKLDNLGMSYLGGVAQLGIPLTSEMGSTFEPLEKPLETISSLAKGTGNVLAKRFTADPLYNTEVINKHYEKFDKLQSEIKSAEKNNIKVPQSKKNILKKLNEINTQIADIRRVKNKISANKKLTRDDILVLNSNGVRNISKLDRLDALRKMQELMVKKAERSSKY